MKHPVFERIFGKNRPVSALRTFLLPGVGIKRWALLLLLGLVLVGMGLAFLLNTLYQFGWLPPVWQIATLQFIPRPLRIALLVVGGVAVVVYAFIRLFAELDAAVAPAGKSMVEMVVERRRKQQGVKVVVIGGGTGTSALLRGLKRYTSNITAIVTVADDGGSSGQLRRSLGVLPPGDFRNCIVALANDEALLAKLFQYRFGDDSNLGNHSFGNLFITAMAAISGSFESGLLESSRVLAIQGRVMPSTLTNVALVAEMRDRMTTATRRVEGESEIPRAQGIINRVYLSPEAPPAYPPAVQAILNADIIVAGPGSLYTSILPNLLVQDIAAAIQASNAQRFFVCNVATQPGETDYYTVADHRRAIAMHIGDGHFPTTLVNSRQPRGLPARLQWVPVPDAGPGFVVADVVDEARPWRHDADKLAAAIMNAYQRDTNGAAA